jgi:tetratricopeptide (TPR) repeat protein
VVCFLGACLAEGLHHAHQRGLVHLDLKPSNVLLTAEAQPLLLDFHLALQPLPAGGEPEWFGGTPQYMSPEQERASSALRQGRPVPEAVDQRSDIWSLGRLLQVALTPDGADADRSSPPLHRRNPQVSVGLSDVIHKCLAERPEDRYRSAAALAADLRRHLAHLPLQGVPNRSLTERWRKWRRRRPNAPLWIGLLLALVTAGGMLVAGALERYREGWAALADGQGQIQRRAYPEAVRTLVRGKSRLEGLPGTQGLIKELDDCLRHARRATAVEQLHAVSERIRLLAGAEVLSVRDLQALEGQCRTVWEARALVADRTQTALEEAVEEQVQGDLLDLALLWTALKLRLTPGNEATRAQARAILTEAEKLCGSSAVLVWERRALEGVVLPEPDRSGRTFWEHVALGRTLLRAGKLESAWAELEQAVDLRPQDFWVHFYRGVCAYRRSHPADAVASFTVALALAPKSPEVYCNRALAHAACGNNAAALRDYDRALAVGPTLAAVALNRGVLHYQEGRYPQALADLKEALRLGADPAAAHYNLALVHLARNERAAAQVSLEHALRSAPTDPQALALRDRLQSAK